MSAMLLAQQILNGLLDGVYYLLIALGLSLIFSLGGIVNLAHGAFYALGASVTLLLSPSLGVAGALVAPPAAVALLGMLIERTLFRRFYRSDTLLSLLMNFRLAMVAEQVLNILLGAPRRASSACDCCCKNPRSPASCAPGCRTRTWSGRSASRCSPIWRPWPRS